METQLSSECARHRGISFLFSARALRCRASALVLIWLVGGFSIPVALAEDQAAPAAESASAQDSETDSAAAAGATGPKEGEVHLNRPVAPDEVRKRRGKHVRAKKQREKWWKTAGTTLFKGIELTPDQDKEITGIIAEQKKSRTEYSKLDIQLAAARAANDLIRSRELRKEVQAARKKVRSLHEVLDSIRPVLTEKQQAIFDVNRAKLIAEGQSVRQSRLEKRSKAKQERESNPKPAAGETGS